MASIVDGEISRKIRLLLVENRKENRILKASELCEELGIKETYLANQWSIIQPRYASYGITLVKSGRGSKAEYGIKLPRDKEIRWERKND